MDNNLLDLLDGDDEDILAKVQEESLRFYNEVELPRLNLEEQVANEKSVVNNDQNNSSIGENIQIESNKPSSSSTKTEEETILYEGDEAQGFHLAAGSTYIYPTNYPLRQYQANITRTAIFKNTLVSLPTGLGKTFIAAVVMYNFYRWYPRGKVVFMAPTRPLVAQQIKACHYVMNIPVDDTTEMTGMNNADQRRLLWKEKRVFYLTPQVMVNDLKTGICPPEHIKCIVFDEAHRAVKDYAYCQVVKLMAASGGQYRTLALSATPGSDINAVQQVIRNLNITVLEIRGEESMDVAPYTHSRSVESIVVELSPNIQRVKEDFLQIYDKYARRLKDHKAFSNNIAFLTKFQVLKACEKFRNNPPRGISPTQLGSLICDFTVCMSLAHSLELLQSYGLRAFQSYLSNEGGEKCKAATSRLKNDEDLQKMLSHLGEILFPKPGSHIPYTWGHPKLQKLVAVITEHFKNSNEKKEETKVIVFCQYRIVVNEIVDILRKCPNIKPAIFIGQSGGKEKGMPQIKQMQIMKDFREGRLNCLVATCVAEEGLDIGEVDLILLMETQKSPVRLVQRLGRTGRKRKGRCVVLLTKGKELEKFHAAMAARKSYVNNIVNSETIKSSLRQFSPSMIPPHIKPQKQLVHINAKELVSPAKVTKNKQIDIRKCFAPQTSPYLTAEQLNEIKTVDGSLELKLDRLPKQTEMWHRAYDPKMSLDELLSKNVSLLSHWNDWNREMQPAHLVSHSKETELLCRLLHLSTNASELNNIYKDEKLIVLSEDSPVEENKGKEKSGLSIEEDLGKVRKNKKAKKENLKHTGKMLDIRTCMALAAEKIKMPKTNDIIIDLIEDSNSPPQIVPSSPTLNNKHDGSIDFLKEIYLLFDFDGEEIDRIKSDYVEFRCPLEKDVEISSRLKKYMIPTNFQLNYNAVVPQIDLPNLDKIIKSFENLLNNSVLNNATNENKVKDLGIRSTEENLLPLLDSDEFVSIDDLFVNDSDQMEENIDINVQTESSCKIEDELEFQKLEKDTLNTIAENQTLNYPHNNIVRTPERVDMNNSVCFEDTPDILKNINLNHFETSKIVSSTPLLPKIVSYKTDNNQKKFTPKVLAVKKSPELVELKEEDEADEDGVWNLSDLLESEPEEYMVDEKVTENSTMIGITQMVSQIEKSKKEKLDKYVDVNHDTKPIQQPPLLNSSSSESFILTNAKTTKTNISNNVELSQKYDKTVAIRTTSPEMVISDKHNTNSCSSQDNRSQSFKPNFCALKQNKKINEICNKNDKNQSSNDSLLSDFDFTTHRTQTNTKPNFKVFKRKENKINSIEKVEKTNIDNIKSNESCESSTTVSSSNSFTINMKSVNISKVKQIISPKINSKINTSEKAETSERSDNFLDSEDDDVFVDPSVNFRKCISDISTSPSPIKKVHKKSKRLNGNGFIEKEADVSGVLSPDDSDNSSLDDLDESFINDETHNHTGNDTHAEYLRSIKSPRGGRGKFKIPMDKVGINMANIYSQQVEQDTDYVNDSFCVDTSEEDLDTSVLSQLEMAERLLELEKRNKKRKIANGIDEKLNKRKKRRRIISPEPETSPLNQLKQKNKSFSLINTDFDDEIIRNSKTKNIPVILLSDSD